jgi:membrane-associated protease RseP (regulator of RpoE activity)
MESLPPDPEREERPEVVPRWYGPYRPYLRPPPPPPPRPWHPLGQVALCTGLFLATALSTALTNGPAYAAAVMVILLSHEMGHYFMCRRYRVRSTLPFFIPFFPLRLPFTQLPVLASPFGTLGALILMRQRVASRKAIFDIGITGPLAGLVPSLIALSYGLAHSTVVPALAPGAGSTSLGDSLALLGLQGLIHPHLPPGMELMLHPVGYAGWAGLFLTSLNLLPVGQLDGGHVLYGLLGRRSRLATWAVLAGVIGLAMFRHEWFVLAALLLLFARRGHPPSYDEDVPLDPRRRALGIFAMAIFVVTFTPVPFSF